MKTICTFSVLLTTFLLVLCNFNTSYAYGASAGNLAIIDTTERDEWLYKPAIEMLENVGFKVTYKPLHLVLDQAVEHLASPRYDAVFFLFGSEFLSGLGRSYFCAKVIQVLEQYARTPGVTVGLIFPSLHVDPRVNIVGSCSSIFQSLGLSTPLQALTLSTLLTHQKQIANPFFYLANVFLTHPMETRPMQYHTTLNLPHGGTLFKNEQLANVMGSSRHPLYLLPLNTECSTTMQQTLPYGLYWFNPVRNNHVFITTSNILTVAGIAENFQICPANVMQRQEMLSLIQRMLWEVSMLGKAKNSKHIAQVASQLKTRSAPKLPSSLTITKRKRKAPAKNISHKIAWMEINAFQDESPETIAKNPGIIQERKEQQVKMIDYIIRSGLDALWVTINPHMYYSPIGRLAGKEKEQIFLQSWSRFTKALVQAADDYGVRVPSLLVGYEITNNIYEPNMPKLFPIDMYENAYHDLPIPTDFSFWQNEVLNPLDIFIQKWKDPEISNGIPLAGVVLDLEMYCRKKTGSFLTPMGFDDQTFKKFVDQAHLGWKDVAIRDRSLLLMRNKQGGAYFRFLEQESEKIGLKMQQHFLKAIPNCQIICYMPHLSTSWFYKGLCKGLGKKNHPLQLLTFNSEFFAHEGWFKKHKINAYHASVLMLSKLEQESDFQWVDYVLDHHHGIWLNRFSRFSEPKARDWTSIEQPRMPEGLNPKFMDYLRER